MASNESDSLASHLKRQKTFAMEKLDNSKREYRIMTGGEDGQIAWWNCLVSKSPANFISKLSQSDRIVMVNEDVE